VASEKKPHIAIAGGGLMGRLLAWRLAQGDYQVTLFEARDFATPSGACWTAAGMISPLSELVHCERVIYDLGMQSLVLWPEWAKQLEVQTGHSAEYRCAGSLLVAHAQDSAELQQFQQELLSKLDGECAAQLEKLDGASLQQLEPALTRFDRGLYLKGEADINNRRLLPLLLNALRQLGVRLMEQTPVECSHNSIESSAGKAHFDCVIDCRGLGAKAQIRGLRGVRGEVLVVETHEIQLQRPVRLLHPRYQLYAVPRPHGRTVIGATEIESEDMSPVSVRSAMELTSALYSLHPAFAEARILETRVNCRPATLDHLPHVHSDAGLIQVNGLYRHGYLLAPALAVRVEELVAQQILQVA
jgi:glycine oxidase